MAIDEQATPIQELTVDLGARSYAIVIGDGVLAELGSRTRAVARGASAFIVSDDNVAPLYLPAAETALKGAGFETASFVVPAGERTKDFAHLERLSDDLLAAGIDRRAVIVALGGGVVGDLAGFAAAVTMRGIDYVQVPTTLLAQVDSSVGGKTAIDTGHGKNLVGAFHQPRLVVADTRTLDTLPRRELLAGYAEVVKYGVLGDADFFAWLEANGPAALAGDAGRRAEMIRHCCAMKAAIVAGDETEQGTRALLNLGHTFGHALEAHAGYDGALLHGEAIAVGMCLAFRLAVELGLADDAERRRLIDHLGSVGLPTTPPQAWPDGTAATWDVGRLMDAIAVDKKAAAGRPAFVLPRRIGAAFVARDVPLETVDALLRDAVAA